MEQQDHRGHQMVLAVQLVPPDLLAQVAQPGHLEILELLDLREQLDLLAQLARQGFKDHLELVEPQGH